MWARNDHSPASCPAPVRTEGPLTKFLDACKRRHGAEPAVVAGCKGPAIELPVLLRRAGGWVVRAVEMAPLVANRESCVLGHPGKVDPGASHPAPAGTGSADRSSQRKVRFPH